MSARLQGLLTRMREDDDDSHRNYRVAFIVVCDDTNDGPQVAMDCPGLPLPGAAYSYGNDYEPFCFCWPTAKATIHKEREGDPPNVWRVEKLFSTRPLKRCQDSAIEDPLLEPQGIAGSWVNYTKEVYKDRFGNLITSSSHEPVRGPQVEFDDSKDSIIITQNVPSLGLDVYSPLKHHVNESPMWGMAERRVRFVNASFERKLYGLCNFYYTRTLEFLIDANTHDRFLLDEGTKVLNGRWNGSAWELIDIDGNPPDPDNPSHFNRYKDRKGENARVILDGSGLPADTMILGTGTGTSGGPGEIPVEYYPEADLFILGVPTSL